MILINGAGAEEVGADDVVGRLFAQLGSPSPAEREIADMRLRNLPLSMADAVRREYAQSKDSLDPEARSRVEGCMATFDALARVQQRRAVVLEWKRKTFLGIYEQHGERNPKWDALAREAIEFGADETMRERNRTKLLEVGQRLHELGCMDGEAMYFVAEAYASQAGVNPMDGLLALRGAMYHLDDKRYPSMLMGLLACRYGAIGQELTAQSTGYDLPSSDWSFGLGRFEMLKPGDGVIPQVLLEMTAKPYVHSIDYRLSEYRRHDQQFGRLAPDSVERLLFRAAAYTHDAMEEFANTNAKSFGYPDGQTRREELLKTAKEALDSAWKKDPEDGRTALAWMRWAIAKEDLGQAKRWFDEVMRLDPDNLEACREWMEHLAPEERLEFARGLARTGNWRGRMPELLLDLRESESLATSNKAAYWARQEVWEDVKLALGGYVAAFPQDAHARSRLARLAMKCGKWKEAERQFALLGNGADMGVFGSMECYRYYQRKVERNAAAAQKLGMADKIER